MRKKIVAGNWKMNTLPAEGVELAKGVAAGRGEVCSCVNFIVCPPFTHLSMVAEALKGSDIALGAQDCATEAKGAYTGEVAAQMGYCSGAYFSQKFRAATGHTPSAYRRIQQGLPARRQNRQQKGKSESKTPIAETPQKE